MKWFRSRGEDGLAVAPTYRYGMLPLFLVSVALILAAPFYWNQTQARTGAIAEAHENADLYQYYYPVYDYAFGRMRGGSVPLWDPRQLCGAPLLADSRVGVFQPLNLPFQFLPAETALALHAFMGLFFMGFFFALFARAVGVGYWAALLGGLIYAFSGLSASAMSRPPLAAALVWTPLLLWAVREYAHRFDTATAIVAGIAAALLILSGAFALGIAAGMVAAAYAVQSLVVVERGSKEFTKRARGLFVILLIALAVSAVQWVPTAAYLWRLDDPLAWVWGPDVGGIVPLNTREFLTQVIVSAPGTQPRIAYVGIVPLILLPASLFHRRRRRDVMLYAMIAASAVLLAVFFAWTPPLRFPAAALLLPVVVSVALLAAIGADRIFTPRTSFRSPSIGLPAMTALAVSLAMFVAFGADVRRYSVPVAAAVIVFALFRFRAFAPICYTALFVVLFVDLANANRTIFAHPRQDAPGCYETYTAALAAAREQSLGGRVLISGRELDRGANANLGMIFSMNLAGGAGMPLTPDQAYWWKRLAGNDWKTTANLASRVTPNAPGARLLRYMATRVIVAAPQGPLYEGGWQSHGPKLRAVAPAGDVHLFVQDDALARAYWVPAVQVEVGMPTTIDALCGDGFNAAQTCIVDAQSEGIGDLAKLSAEKAGDSGTRPSATCSVEDVTPERVVVRVDAPQAGVTVLCDNFYPGWTAAIDRRNVPILKVNGVFRGVATPAGPHEIVFTYRPWSVYVGAFIACATLLLLLVRSLRPVVGRG